MVCVLFALLQTQAINMRAADSGFKRGTVGAQPYN